MDISGKVAIVTGGVHGLGAVTAMRLNELGARVVVADIEDIGKSEEPGLAKAIRSCRKLDVRNIAQWRQVLAEVVRDEGALDIVHLNAGVISRPLSQEMDDDPLDWVTEQVLERVTAINIAGVANGVIAALPYLRKSQGSIVITASIAGVRGYVVDPIYSMSKHAVVGLARALAPRLIKEGVKINVVCPGGMDTRMVPDAIRPKAALSTPQHMADVICRVIRGDGTGGIWLAPADNTVRRFDIDPIAYTADQASQRQPGADLV